MLKHTNANTHIHVIEEWVSSLAIPFVKSSADRDNTINIYFG